MRKLKGREDNMGNEWRALLGTLWVRWRSLVVIIQLPDFASYLANLPPLQAVLGVQYDPVLLLKFP